MLLSLTDLNGRTQEDTNEKSIRFSHAVFDALRAQNVSQNASIEFFFLCLLALEHLHWQGFKMTNVAELACQPGPGRSHGQALAVSDNSRSYPEEFKQDCVFDGVIFHLLK